MATDTRVVWMPGDLRTEIHLAAEDTDGAFCLLVDHPPVGWSLPAHRHQNESETVHIIDGDFEMEIDGSRVCLSAGQTVHIPRGVIHSGGNSGQRPGRRLVLFAPGGMEGFFLEVGASAPDDEIDPSGALASATRYGWEFVRPTG